MKHIVTNLKKKVLSGIVMAENNNKEEFYVLNGDIFNNKSYEIETENKIGIPTLFQFNLNEIESKYGDKDGLIFSENMTEYISSKPEDRIFEIDKCICFPLFEIKKIVECTFDNRQWNNTRIRISKIRHKFLSGAVLYGIDFRKAILKAMSEGISTAHLYKSDLKEWITDGILADFLIKITQSKNGNIEFNAWQAIDNSECLYFAHGIIDSNNQYFTHLDFAFHYTELSEIQRLLSNGKDKPILINKEKIFRIDGQISFDLVFEYCRLFFPIDELVDEYYYSL